MADTAVTQRNLRWPLVRGAKGASSAILHARFHSAIRNFVRTPYSSLRWDTGYGSLVDELRTQNISNELADEHRNLLTMGISTYIPDIQIYDIRFAKLPQSDKLSITVMWDIPNASSRDMHARIQKDESQKTTVVI